MLEVPFDFVVLPENFHANAYRGTFECLHIKCRALRLKRGTVEYQYVEEERRFLRDTMDPIASYPDPCIQ